ncbi:MAG TPA: aspartate-semialdehyde dehydrogenase [Flavobacteriales bacterium]|jgi:aspartate-semialdehyde dehydrogenase|nr:aspartate-semialdehyde dehydrogenase [Flavobacteriales bacterium]HJN63457.1 aspartate-semialdehyde dehydrogenase [Flavobacteriales bacterium]|tara:strand:+ start:2161 stop:3147 length:987 start_codon:yes stop_codon:yes gene_type:complete
MKLAIVGVTGMVGREMLEVLAERNFPITELIPVASEKSCGKQINYLGKSYEVISLLELLNTEVDLALFSAGANVSKIWAPKLAEKGIKVIDNSSYWRMCSNHKLIVPEINGSELSKEDKIIANPNCSTIQLVMALAPLHKKFGVKRVVVSTYQSITGTGKKAVEQLENEEKRTDGEMVYPHTIYQNILPHCDDFTENGYTKEEMKLTNETKKILDENIDVVATAVRVPVVVGHSESVNITFENEFDLNEARLALNHMEGVVVMDNPTKNEYPMPINSYKKDEVFVGRIRIDFTQEKTLNMWIVADNLRKGAATNTVQIAEYLINNNLV